MECINRIEQLFRRRSSSPYFSIVDSTTWIKNINCMERKLLGFRILHTKTLYNSLIGIACKRELQTKTPDKRLGMLWRIHRNAQNGGIARIKSRFLTLQLTELRIARGSPVPSIEHDNQIRVTTPGRKFKLTATRFRQPEGLRLLANTQSIWRGSCCSIAVCADIEWLGRA